jgi:hypothetical protein
MKEDSLDKKTNLSAMDSICLADNWSLRRYGFK